MTKKIFYPIILLFVNLTITQNNDKKNRIIMIRYLKKYQ